MFKIIVITSLILVLIGCNSKQVSTHSKTTSMGLKCKSIERKILQLEEEKELGYIAKVVTALAGSYAYGVDSKEIKQKIKVLKMELDSCNRR